MSLNNQQRRATASELAQHCHASGLSRDEMLKRTGRSEQDCDAAFAVDDVMNPAHVWLLRDILEDACRDRGASVTPFSVLTEDKRDAAWHWCGYRKESSVWLEGRRWRTGMVHHLVF